MCLSIQTDVIVSRAIKIALCCVVYPIKLDNDFGLLLFAFSLKRNKQMVNKFLFNINFFQTSVLSRFSSYMHVYLTINRNTNIAFQLDFILIYYLFVFYFYLFIYDHYKQMNRISFSFICIFRDPKLPNTLYHQKQKYKDR